MKLPRALAIFILMILIGLMFWHIAQLEANSAQWLRFTFILNIAALCALPHVNRY